ncbi:MAG: hypothetical protein HYZ12_05035 [Thaumarchaeota archaeon]|nr:hypothetical protein [Nitrososphaerota archaeon]
MIRKDVRDELIEVAKKRRTVTYGYLMKKFGLSRGHPRGCGIAGVIGEIGRYERERGAPGFGAIVVRKDTGYPGGGYFCYDDLPGRLRRARSQSANPRLSPAEKEHIDAERMTIWNYYQRHHRRVR